MSEKLSIDQAKAMLKEALNSFPYEVGTTCECYMGYLTQLEIDSDESVAKIFKPYKPEKNRMHGCLGCDPFPPADLFADYLQCKNQPV